MSQEKSLDLAAPMAKAEMQIRRPVAEVFEAFVDPAITSKFWFTKSSGRLEAGKKVQWDWEMYKFSADAHVRVVEPNRRLVVDWTAYGPPSTVEWTFRSLPDGSTFVSITNGGFSGDPGRILKNVVDSTEGFASVLAGAKAYLEHGLQLHLVRDRFPEGMS